MKLTCATGDDKLLQTHVYIQILLKHWELKEKNTNKEECNRLYTYVFLNMHWQNPRSCQNISGSSHVYLSVYENITE